MRIWALMWVSSLSQQRISGDELLVRGGDQVCVIGFGQVARSPLRQYGCGSGRRTAYGHRAGSRSCLLRIPARSLSRHHGHRGMAAAGPGVGLRRAQNCPASSSKHKYAPVAAASLEASPRSRPARWRWRPRRARRPGARGPAGFTRFGAADTRCRAACSAHGTAARSGWSSVPAFTAGPQPSPSRPGPVPARHAAGTTAPDRVGRSPRPAPSRRAPRCRYPASVVVIDRRTSCLPAVHGLPAPV